MTDSPRNPESLAGGSPASALFPWSVIPEPAAGEKRSGYFSWPKSLLQHLNWPYFAIRGSHPGNSVAIISGIHGADYAAILGTQRLGRLLRPERLSGSLLLLPIINVSAFRERTSPTTPQDGRDLNVVFPGRATGTFSEVLAWRLTEDVVAPADAVLSVGSGGSGEAVANHSEFRPVGDRIVDDLALETAESIGLPYMVEFSLTDTPGSLANHAASMGKLSVAMNVGSDGTATEDDVLMVYQGLINALRTLGLLTGQRMQVAPERLESGYRIAAPADGLWQPAVSVTQAIAAGDVLGTLTDALGHEIARVTAESPGLILRQHSVLAVRKGESLVYVARTRARV